MKLCEFMRLKDMKLCEFMRLKDMKTCEIAGLQYLHYNSSILFVINIISNNDTGEHAFLYRIE